MAGYIIERNEKGIISYENRIYTYLDNNGNVLQNKDGVKYVFESVSFDTNGWRAVTINNKLKGYLTPDWDLISFEAKNIYDIEHGFGKIEKFDGKSYFFNAHTKTLEENGYELAFVIGKYTRVVGDDKNGWKILFYGVSPDKEVSRLMNTTFDNRQDAIWKASEFELNYTNKVSVRKKSARIMPTLCTKGLKDDDGGHTV